MPVVFCVDLEDWYHSHDFNISSENWDNYEDRIENNTRKLLEVFAKRQVSAVFFVLGYIAEKHPALVREIVKNGHEIGSHSMLHRKVSLLEPDEFRRDLLASKAVIENAIGQKVEYYRAPSWTVNWDMPWFFQILEEEGFILDSSVQPFKTFLSGMRAAPIEPFHPIVGGKKLKLVEYPSTVFQMGHMKVPFAGGFYLRSLPLPVIASMLRKTTAQRDCLLYVHPWEIDYGQPRMKKNVFVRMEHSFGLARTLGKIDELLAEFKFDSMKEILEGGNFDWVRMERG